MRPAKDYPILRGVLEREFARLEREKGRQSVRRVAGQIKVTAAAVSTWKLGQQAPNANNIDKLARFFWADDQISRERLAKELAGAVRPDDPSNSAVGPAALRMGVVKYEPFTTEFLLPVYRRFREYAGIRAENAVETNVSDFQGNLSASSSAGPQLDCVMGILETVDRVLRYRFISTPIRVALNGVVLAAPPLKRQDPDIWKQLTPENRNLFVPVVHQNEIGYAFAKHFLGYDIEDDGVCYRVPNFDETEYADALKDAKHRRFKHDGKPIVLADEFFCLRVLEKLGKKNPAKLILLPATGAKGESPRPRYRLALAFADESRWYEPFARAFDLFLEVNAKEIAVLYSKLATRLADLLGYYYVQMGLAKETADPRLWVIHALALDMENTPHRWQAVVKLAHDMLQDDPAFRKVLSKA